MHNLFGRLSYSILPINVCLEYDFGYYRPASMQIYIQFPQRGHLELYKPVKTNRKAEKPRIFTISVNFIPYLRFWNV